MCCRLWPPTVSLTKLHPQERALDKRIRKIKAEGQRRKSQRWKKNKDRVFKEREREREGQSENRLRGL